MDADTRYLVDVTYTILVLFGLTFIASIIEALALRFGRRGAYDWRAALTSFVLFFGYSLTALVPAFIAIPGALWLYQHRILEPAELGVWSYVLLVLGVEFLYYWWHRTSHRVRWFWLSHVVHHTANELNISASYRIGWTSRITASYVIFAPLLLLGFKPDPIFATYGLLVAYQGWIHADWFPKLGLLEGILNTPSAHRVHHAANLEYIDANYGAVLMIFDRLFGTYRAELPEVPVRYGLVKPLYSYNPLKIAFCQFVPLVRELYAARSVREVFGYLFAPPGWRPDGNGTTTEDLRRRAGVAAPAVTIPRLTP